MLIICQIDWREVGLAFELQCLRNCMLSSCTFGFVVFKYAKLLGPLESWGPWTLPSPVNRL